MIRGYIAPDKNDEFRKQNMYNNNNLEVLRRMQNYLRGGISNLMLQETRTNPSFVRGATMLTGGAKDRPQLRQAGILG